MLNVPTLPRIPVGDQTVTESPGWWLRKLDLEIGRKRARINRLRSYARGDAPTQNLADKSREAFGMYQRRSRVNVGGVAVDTMMDASSIVGIRTGAEGEDYDDAQAWTWWQANELDADASTLDQDTYTIGEAVAIVGPFDDEIGAPLVTIEDPLNIAIARSPKHPRSPRAFLKRFTDEWTGEDHAYLYLRQWDADDRPQPALVLHGGRKGRRGKWEWIGEGQTLPFPQLPIAWFRNQLQSDQMTYYGEFEQHTDAIDLLNTTILTRLVIGAMQAMRQRAIINLPTNKSDGTPYTDAELEEIFSADPAALWRLPKGVEFWESQLTDPTWLLTAEDKDLAKFAAALRIPMAALLPASNNQSSQNVDLLRYGFEAKMLNRIGRQSQGYERIVQLMYLWMKQPDKAKRADMEMLWSPLRLPTMAERFDAVAKASAAGVDDRWVAANVLGMSPQEMRRYWKRVTPAEVVEQVEDETQELPAAA